MNIEDYLGVVFEIPFYGIVRAVDSKETNQYDLIKLKDLPDFPILCNQLIWNYLLQTSALTPSSWGPGSLKREVVNTSKGLYEMKYTFHTIPAEPINILSFPDCPEVYKTELKRIMDMCDRKMPYMSRITNSVIDGFRTRLRQVKGAL